MPELPEVETSRRGIEPHLHNRKISDVIIRQHKLRWPIPKNLPSLATGQKIRQVCRRAKYIYLKLDSGSIIIHLGMSGSLRICSAKTAPQKHDHIDIIVSSNKILRLRDPRKFGCVLWQPGDIDEHKLIAPLGPEPLDDEFDTRYLHDRASKRTCSIKSLIMNSHIVVGVGNIYASEALFRAGINPKRKAGNISLLRIQKLVDAIKLTLSLAIEQGGTTLRDFTGSSGQPGYFAQKLLVYGRTSEPCTVCGNNIKQITQQGRSTFYCARCQR
ncbi:MAG: bifunctional DNA-formamidopyrimidine glycosylase/DNA-(apurinic or apyrimidinic site) lyase [Gammaproteobacteria bacterium]|nr:bifunctional DNA-formamidopyrimidine glycosylase/DNA-(apurinic or apyrimidinic site) lyase [Gammaproteobacteria bacterium]NNJ48874.1 bifunctional DNA-formamidopyrimidine glycosylase/DNA-(apurinic or apyrimidinic site) lyase [Gammaproteobacteria bacterium]